MFKIIFILMIQFHTVVFASGPNVDPFNTFRWNRQNILNNTNTIDKGPWFEWWYYKINIPKLNEAFFFVYGVVNPWDHQLTMKGTRSFVSMGDFAEKKQMEKNFDLSSFAAEYERTYIEMPSNIATNKRAVGRLENKQGETYQWDFSIKKDWAFNATSWATGKMITNIEWYPAQAAAKCTGKITRNGEVIPFKDAPCYQDRNWGHSFPDWWTWIVSNSFEKYPHTALAIGGGKPTFYGRFKYKEGVNIGLLHKGKKYAWRINELDKIKMDVSFGKWEVSGINRKHKITISAFAPKEDFLDIQFITPKGEIFHDFEALTGKVTVKLFERKGVFSQKWRLVETLISHYAGIEYGTKKSDGLNQLFTHERTLINTNKY